MKNNALSVWSRGCLRNGLNVQMKENYVMVRGERGVVLALQNEFSDIFMSFFLKVFADISPNVELCQYKVW